MKIKITALSNNIYQFADKTISDDTTGIWRGRIVNAPDISRNFSDLGSVASTLYIQLINYDLQIPLTEDLWNASIDVETDNGYKWTGKVSAYETNADGKMYITATETTAPEYSRYIPDEFARLVSIDEDVHMSALNVTIPTVIGGNANNPIPVKGILKSKSDAIYYLCVGEIHDIVKVRVGDKTMTRAEAAEQGYICYTSSPDQINEPGIAYIQITDTSKRLNDDGSYVDIGAEVIGLKLGNHTIEECRNGARFLYWLLKTASSGVCGWGLGISTNDIDTASFETAMTYVDLIGLKLDGVLYDNRSAQNWIDEICRAIRGTYEIGSDGKRRLSIDVASTSSYTYTKNNIELVRFGAGSFTGRVYNKGILNYSYNPITGMFMQSSQYQNAESIARIDEQLFEGESYLIRDAETAQKIVEYTCKKSLIEANKILFNTRFLPENCRIGAVITINYPEKGMNNSLFKITSLQIGDHINRIEAVKYDENIYTSGQVSTTIAWQNEEPILSSISAPSIDDDFLALSSNYDILPDGTGYTSITGSFTMPNGKYLTAVVEYGEGSSPATWYSLGMLKDNSFRISPLKVYTIYSVRLRLVSSNGHSNFIVKNIRTAQDSSAPGAPTVTLSAMLRTVSVYCKLNNPPDDMGGFAIYRKLSSGSTYEVVGMVAANKGDANSDTAEAVFTDVVVDYATYQYQAKSYDRSGNLSAASSAVSITTTPAVSEDFSVNSFSMPQGSTLRISAKGCSSSSILNDKGVKDVSGRVTDGSTSGKATGSYIQVVMDNEKGPVFKKAAHASAHNITMPGINIGTAMSYAFWCKWDTKATAEQIILGHLTSAANGGVRICLTKSAVTIRYWNNTTSDTAETWNKSVSISTSSGKWFQIGISLTSTSGLCIYKDGVLISSDTSKKLSGAHNTAPAVYLFQTNAANSGYWYLHDVRIYSRELTGPQFKTLFMFPDDVYFGAVTADMIYVNELWANFIGGGFQIKTANIEDLAVTTDKIADLAVTTAKMAAKSVTAAKIADKTITAAQIADKTITNTQIADSTIQCGKFNVAKAVFVQSGSTAAAGIVPSPGTTAGTTKFLCEDATWKTIPAASYPNFIKSGSTAAKGAVPAPPTTAGTTKFLCEDATWKVPSTAKLTPTVSNAWYPIVFGSSYATAASDQALRISKATAAGTIPLAFDPSADATAVNKNVYAYLRIGNGLSDADATNYANARRGCLRLYGRNTAYTDIITDVGTTTRTLILPDKNGTVALTSDITSAVTSVYAAGNTSYFDYAYTRFSSGLIVYYIIVHTPIPGGSSTNPLIFTLPVAIARKTAKLFTAGPSHENGEAFAFLATSDTGMNTLGTSYPLGGRHAGTGNVGNNILSTVNEHLIQGTTSSKASVTGIKLYQSDDHFCILYGKVV